MPRSAYVIWQYWETVGDKPAFIDGLHEIARKNAGAEVVLVTPETLGRFLPEIPPEIFRIGEVAHKADMIRAMLVSRHGGMWLDSDAVVLRRLDSILGLLDEHEFVGFNDGAALGRPEGVRVNCFASRPAGRIVSEWVSRQHAKFPRTEFAWGEVGTDLLHPICLGHKDRVKMLPFEAIAPVPWGDVARFTRRDVDAEPILHDCYAVMLSNSSLKRHAPSLYALTVEQIAAGDHLLARILRHALTVTA